MAISIAWAKKIPAMGNGQPRDGLLDVTLDNSYPTGGWSLTPASIGWKGFFYAAAVDGTVGGFFFQYDRTNSKLKAYWCAGSGAAATEVSNLSAALNALVVRLECRGW